MKTVLVFVLGLSTGWAITTATQVAQKEMIAKSEALPGLVLFVVGAITLLVVAKPWKSWSTK